MANQISRWAKRLTSGIGRTIETRSGLSRILLMMAVTGHRIGLWPIVLVFVVVDVLWKPKLISDVGSAENEIAVAAVEKLYKRGWLAAGALRGADLAEANLRGANLREADLRKADLRKADLRGADLSRASLGVYEIWGIFEGLAVRVGGGGTDTGPADLRWADLTGADLSWADLTEADLRGANLSDAHLVRANLGEAKFDTTSILPDRTTWTPDTDMTRFTDDYPDFWFPD